MVGALKWALWGLMLAGAVFAAGNAVLFMTVDGVGDPAFKSRFLEAPLFGWSHTMGGLVAVLIGPFQFLGALRRRFHRVHVWMGRIYLLAVGASALAGLYFAASSPTGWISALGFTGMSLAWLGTGALAYRAVRCRDFQLHRRWMIRNYAITFAAVSLRVELGLMLVLGLTLRDAFLTVSWLCWLGNLALVQAWVRPGMGRRPEALKPVAPARNAA